EPHNVLHAGAVVPTTVKNDDLARRREMEVHLRLLAVRRSGESDDAKHARAHAFRNRSDGATFTGAVAPFEQHDDPQALLLDPLLEVTKLCLQPAQFLFVLLAFELWYLVVVLFFRHSCYTLKSKNLIFKIR